MEFQQNLFDSGMNQDLSKTLLPPNKYYSALNFRISTDKGLSTGSLENIRGNIECVDIPNIPAVQQIKLNNLINGNLNISITDGIIIGVNTSSININSSTTIKELYSYIINDPGYDIIKLKFNLYYNNDYILFLPLNIDDILTINVFGSASGSITIDNNFIPSQIDLEPIGSTFINDDIYILTTNNKTKSPGKNDPPSYGQIWKIIIDDVSNLAGIELIYNNLLNFSTYNAFAPTAILGRYETPLIQRIYFSDFFNPIRTLNVADPQAFAIDISQINITPIITSSIPILKKITTGGNNKVGTYQLAYRLTKTGGAITSYSSISNVTDIVPRDEGININGADFFHYRGEAKGTVANKIIYWTINNIDISFDRIELVIIIREDKTDVPSIYKFNDLPIDIDGKMEVSFSGNETLIPITLNDFLISYESFSYCKTITTKDNRLIIGNIKGSLGNIDTFDTRTYRSQYINNFNIDLINNGSRSTYTYNDLININLNPEERDNINDYSSVIYAGKYKPGTSIIGGSGKNISYEFGTYSTQCDLDQPMLDLSGLPLRHPNPNYAYGDIINLGIEGQDYDQNGINDGLTYAYKSHLLQGYQRDEIYRFGLQVFDKSGNPFFTKWIGDIKFPSYFDNNNNPDSIASNNGINDFRLIYHDTTNSGATHYYLQQLYIKFTVNIPFEISSLIGSYNIVRVERKNKDKTIFGSGLIFPTIKFAPDNANYVGSDLDFPITVKPSLSGVHDFNVITFQIPEFLFAGYYSGLQSNDTIKVEANLTPDDYTPFPYKPDVPTPTGGEFGMFKMYYFSPNSDPYGLKMDSCEMVVTGGIAAIGTYNFNNYQKYFGDGAQYVGTNTLIAKFSNNNALNPIDYENSNNKLYFGTYRRVLLNQYGGNTYNDRASNEYISCGNLQVIPNVADNYIYTTKVFGGDIFVGLMDNQKFIRNIGTNGVPIPSDSVAFPVFSKVYFFPCESSINTELRYGAHINTDLVDSTATAWDYQEEYFFNPAYSNENNIRKYFPKPPVFIDNSEFNNRFYASEIKINGEITDSWRTFKSLNYWDVEGSYGQINGASILNNDVYFIQDKAFGKLLVNTREVITTQEGNSVGLGLGKVLDGHQYVSTEIGSKHQFSFIKSSYYLHFIDSRHKKIYSFSTGNPLTPDSDIKGMHSWLINNFIGNIENIDRPIYEDPIIGINGIHGVYDYINNELLYTITRSSNDNGSVITKKDTLIISHFINSFTGKYSHAPKIYITNNKKFISSDKTNSLNYNNLFLHNFGEYGKFYNEYFDSEIEVVVNKFPEYTKIFDNIVFQTEVQDGNTLIDIDSGFTPIEETFDTAEFKTDYQSNIISLIASNLIRKYRTWRLTVPRNSTQASYVSSGLFSRMRDKYMKIKFKYMNNGNKRLIVHNILTFFRINSPK